MILLFSHDPGWNWNGETSQGSAPLRPPDLDGSGLQFPQDHLGSGLDGSSHGSQTVPPAAALQQIRGCRVQTHPAGLKPAEATSQRPLGPPSQQMPPSSTVRRHGCLRATGWRCSKAGAIDLICTVAASGV